MLDGRLALTTPEGVRLLLTPAGPAPRAMAMLLDMVLFGVFISIVSAILNTTVIGAGVHLIVYFVASWGYPVICEVYFGGRTIGKKALGIEVLRADGLPVGWRESGLRNILLVADFMPLFYAGGLVCMLFDLRFRRIGDIVAGTQVVYSDRKVQRLSPIGAEVEPLALPFPLTASQQRTLADLFERERGLAPERMAELGDIAAPLTQRLGEESVERMRRMVAGLGR